MADWFHVTSSHNRDSIKRHGLDWRRMGVVRGIAGSSTPEQEGCFVCPEQEVDWFVQMNNTGGLVDVWSVEDVDEDALVQSPEGYEYVPAPIPPDRLRLVRADIEPVDHSLTDEGSGDIAGSIRGVFRRGHPPDQE